MLSPTPSSSSLNREYEKNGMNLKKGRNSVRRFGKLGVMAVCMITFVLANVALDHYRGRPDIHGGGKGMWSSRSDSFWEDDYSPASSSSSSFFLDPSTSSSSSSSSPDSYTPATPLPISLLFSSPLIYLDSLPFLDFGDASGPTGGAGLFGDAGSSGKCQFPVSHDEDSQGILCAALEAQNVDVCILVDKHCSDKEGLIDYEYFYCNFSVGWACVVFILVPWLVVIFYLLGMTAEDYFCPVLNIISDRLALSPDVAGITILALGNGSPDVFSTIVAIQSPPDGFRIAIGELIGAGCFVSLTVVGVVALVATCNLKKVSFIRDVSFYMCALLIVASMIAQQQIYIYESLLLLVGYALYVGVSVGMNFLNKPKKTGAAEALLSEHEEDENDFGDVDFSGLEEESRKIYLSKVGIVVQDEDDEVRVHTLSDGTISPSRGRRSEVQIDPSYEQLSQEIRPNQNDRHSLNSDVGVGTRSTTFSDLDFDSDEAVARTFDSYREQFIEESGWDDKDWKERVLYILFSPFIFLFNCTIPIPDEENWQRRWCYLSPIFIPFVLFTALGAFQYSVGGLPIFVIVELCTLPVAGVLYMTTDDKGPPTFKGVFIIISFLMAIIWIYLIANELVALLTALGEILSIPPDVMGLTVLAWGNSVGDMVSNVVVAKQGYPAMALAATYGGPLFNLFMGLGLSITLWTALHFGDPYCVNFTATVVIAMCFLVVGLGITLIVVSLNGFVIPRKFSFFLIGWYSLYMLIALLNKGGVITFG